ncbi:MAG: hypothetical protein ABFS56_34930 [Pseudomonadota bacterium]
MKNLLLTGILTLGLGLTAANANSASEALDRHLVAIDYDIAGEGQGIGEFTEAKYQEIKAAKVANVSQPTQLERILKEAFRSTRTCEDPCVD